MSGNWNPEKLGCYFGDKKQETCLRFGREPSAAMDVTAIDPEGLIRLKPSRDCGALTPEDCNQYTTIPSVTDRARRLLGKIIFES